jgi:5-methyltetrahydrofolate--homocysteine methyltransferase
MIRVLVDNGANIIGANCGNGVAGMIDITREIRKTNQTIPVLIHANAGMPVYKEGETVFPESPDVMAGHALNLIQQGANVIGGCCGTTPDHIRKIRGLVDGL